MDTDGVMRWVEAYERAWRENDVGAVRTLFTEGAEYHHSPYEPPKVGHAAIEAFWPEEPGTTFTATAEPVAVQGDTAVVRLQVDYLTPETQQYRDLWVLHFAPDGRVDRYEEWPFHPGQAWTAES
jgi:hypothetical protein